ncbi:MAG: PRC-barrel domain-containing protein [Gemmatimonadetes bacterium]|nr:PRC-barrel domain-containing protein [Gemmatimonadota bacterium]
MRHDDLDRVVPLDELDDFRVSRDDPDPRGWEVVAADGRKVGEVDELLVDTSVMKVRYLDVDLDDGVSGEPDRHVLVPIGYARLDADHDRVLVDEITSHDLRAIPAYRHGPLTRDFETSVRDSWRGGRRETHHEERGIHGEMREMRREDNVERGGPGPVSGGIRADAADDFYDGDLFDESKFWAARRATGLGGALGDIGADAGYPSDLGDRT